MRETELAGRMRSLRESATLKLNARAKQWAAEGKTVFNLTAGELATDTPDYIQKAVSKKLGKNKYTPVAGLPELRSGIAAMARDFYRLEWIQPDNVVVTAGAKPALYVTFLALINPGDEVIVPAPYWVSYIHLIELVGGVVVAVPLTDDFDLDPAAIKTALSPKTKAILVNSPHNPTGAVFSENSLKTLASLLHDTKVTVIADDIYAKLAYVDDFRLVPTCGFERLVIINGFSKSQALTGWRVGYLIADKNLADATTSLLSHITGNTSLPAQYAALAALERDDRPPQETLDALKHQRQLVCEGLDAIPSIIYRSPGGAFYVLMDIRNITSDSESWCEKLLAETGVALVPGEAFGAPGFARLTFVTDERTLKKALELLKTFVGAS